MTKDKSVKTVASAGIYLIVWVAECQIHQQYLCNLCSTMPLQYVLLMLTGLKRKVS